jgi:hypothetical protein
MFCDACGAQVEANQRFCSTCGKALGAIVAGRVSTRVADHRHILGILWVIYGFFHLVAAGILFVMGTTFFPHLIAMNPPRNGPPLAFLPPLIVFISVLILAKGLLALAGGVGLLQRSPWARTITLISAFLGMLSIPFGLALGIYSLWVLMSTNAESDYAKLAGRE